MIKWAKESGILTINLVDIRDFADNRHRKVDDRPYGGGPGMVMMAPPVAKAIRSLKSEKSKVIFLTPQGTPLTAKVARRLASYEHLILLCGHYEGVDERIIEIVVDEEISIGDYVLTNGCIAAIVLLDAVSRFVPGVIGEARGVSEDSFEEGIFDCPHYTRPEEFEGKKVPEVLLSGNHREIAAWRKLMAEAKTKRVRPELLKNELNEKLGDKNE